MRKSDLDYDLPPDRIAQQPAATRRASRLLVVDRAAGTWADHTIADLPELLRPGDLMVVNDTQVVPARFTLRRATGGRVEGLWLGDTPAGCWRVLLRNSGALRAGERLTFAGHALEIDVVSKGPRGEHTLRPVAEQPTMAVLAIVGRTPLPPYIKRDPDQVADADIDRYQTVYAARPGAVAAPTAGLHFDEDLLHALAARGVDRRAVTLHVGPGTFQPVVEEELAAHTMHSERYDTPSETVEAVQRQRAGGGRIIAVGTTVVRVLETLAAGAPAAGDTSIFIYPPYTFRSVDVLLTNFHLPQSTLLALVYAFGGTELIRAAYRHAVERHYRFFSYGDAMLIV